MNTATYNRSIAVLGAVVGMAVGVASARGGGAPPDLSIIAYTGQQAPGIDPGVVFARLDSPRINDSGEVLYWALLTGDGVTTSNDEALFGMTVNADGVILAEGDVLAPQPTWTFEAFPSPAFGPEGQVLVSASFIDTAFPGPANRQATTVGVVLQDRYGNEALIAEDDILYTADYSTVAYLTAEVLRPLTPSGVVGAQAGRTMTTAAGDVIAGDPAPGTALEFQGYFTAPRTNSAGRVLFTATLVETIAPPPPDGATTLVGMYTDRDGALELVALTGDTAPGAEGASYLRFSGRPAMNDGGVIAFAASLAHDEALGVDGSNDMGVWTDRSGVLSLLAREGSPAPGVEDAVFSALGAEVELNGDGDVLLSGHVVGDGVTAESNAGVWVYRAGEEPALLAREGDPAPGIADAFFAGFVGPTMNEAGDVAMTVTLRGAGVGPGDNTALYVFERSGEVTLVQRDGQPIDLGDGNPNWTVDGIVFAPDEGSTGRGQLNNRGSLVYQVHVIDEVGGEFSGEGAALVRADFGCPADWNHDGAATSQDFIEFLNAFFAGDADFDGNTQTTSPDFFQFLGAFFEGC